MNSIPNCYQPPLGLPLYWRDEVSGRLIAAVDSFYKLALCEINSIPVEQLELLWDYVDHHIHAPCWEVAAEGNYQSELAELRARAKRRGTIEDLNIYLRLASEIAIDPL